MRVFDKFEMSGQFFRFVAVGASNLILTYIVYLLFLLILQPVPSILIATGAGIVYTMTLNIKLAFRKELHPLVLSASFIYYAIYAATYAILLDLVIQHFSVSAILAPIPVLFVTLPIHFVCARWLTLCLSPRTNK